MLEDTNSMIYLEAIKIIEILAKMKVKEIAGKIAKSYTNSLFNKFKEIKTSIVNSAKNCIFTLVETEAISSEKLFKLALNYDSSCDSKKTMITNSKYKICNPKVKHVCLQLFVNQLSDINKSIYNCADLELSQLKFLNGVINSQFEEPLLNIIITESSNIVREEAIKLLKELKNSCLLIGTDTDIICEGKHISIDLLLSKLPKKTQLDQILAELDLEEFEIEGNKRYLRKKNSLYDNLYFDENIEDNQVNKEKDDIQNKIPSSHIKSKIISPYIFKEEEFKDIVNYESVLNKLNQVFKEIQTIDECQGVDILKVEQIIKELKDEDILNYCIKYIIECIKHTLILGLSGGLIDDSKSLIFDEFYFLIKNLLTYEIEVKDPCQILDDVVTVMFVMSIYQHETNFIDLTSYIFNWCRIQNISEKFLNCLGNNLCKIYCK